MKQSRTSGTALMSTSCLPLLCPVVGKAPVLASRPKQKLPTPSQQALFTLLKQRHERYRTQKESIAADPSAAHDWGKQTVHVYPSATSLMQYDAGYGAPYSPSGSLHKRTSATNLFSDLGCSDLADHVVHRAKVRLKKRHQKRVLSLRTKRTPYCEANPQTLGCPGSQMLLLVIGEQNRQRQLRHSMHSTRNSSGQVNHSKDFKSADVLASLEAPTRLSVLPEAENYGSSSPGPSSSTMQLHPKSGDHSTNEDCKPKLRVVYLSERQSGTSKITGIPDAPPATPNEAHKHTHSFKYVPSLHDIKSQRLLKTRLQEMMTKAKEGSLQASQATKEEERKQREAVAKLKAQQRAEIYALNKIMTEYEEQKFQDSLSIKV